MNKQRDDWHEKSLFGESQHGGDELYSVGLSDSGRARYVNVSCRFLLAEAPADFTWFAAERDSCRTADNEQWMPTWSAL